MNRTTLRGLVVAAAAAGIVASGSPALANHGGDHRPRPVPPAEPRGLYQSGQIECTPTYPDGPNAPPVFVCSEDNRPEQANFPQTGPGNSFTGGNKPN